MRICEVIARRNNISGLNLINCRLNQGGLQGMGEQSENTAEPKGFVWTQEAVKDVEGFIEHIADK